ncbi:LysR substrate-binding domain-containing protein [Kitasatospora arboriphila]
MPALLAYWADALAAARAAAGRPAVLRVGFESGTIHLVGLATVEAFARRMPGWQVRLRQFNGFDSGAALDAGEIDLALWHAPPEEGGEGGATADGRYGCAPLGLDERWVVLPAGHRLARPRRVGDGGPAGRGRGLGAERWRASGGTTGWARTPAADGRCGSARWCTARTSGWRRWPAGRASVSPRPRSAPWRAAPTWCSGRCAGSGRAGPVSTGRQGRPPTPAAEAFVRSCRETVAVGGRVRPPTGAVDQTASNGAG